MDQATIVYVIGGALVLLAIMAFSRKSSEKVLGFDKTMASVVLVLVGAFLIAGQYGALTGLGVTFSAAGVSGGSGVSTPENPSNEVGGPSFFQPTATYSSKDKYATTTISGTSYYKVNGQPATTTAYTDVNNGDTITYWVDNSSYYVSPLTKVAGTGVNKFVADSWRNGTVTLSAYDLTNRVTVTSGQSNTTMDANSVANIEVTYQGTAKRSAAPFGGVMVVEYNSTMSSVQCTGDDLLTSNPYHVTYTTNSTAGVLNTYRTFAFGPTLDDGSGSPKRISCQFQNGATDVGAGASYYFTFHSANYYPTNDGNIVLDVEQYDDQDTAKTGVTNQRALYANWG